ncbi:5-formyltetrahydrofolate cyclo-ligase-like [Sycon ciliatum]|uniref:5-formyltetrahydrofolate cyclo-ligase-like n=1 Tax=Sycon ciliatum TaxID=27933 RepID=UPI0020ABEF4B|eukprot:scpid62088/ scgid32044/ 5-formyltetrahydrofolate cyclo-ligase; 5,10-methenyl-tetrahydrofolate synthetase
MSAATVRAAKQALRKEIKSRIKALTAEVRDAESTVVQRKLLATPQYHQSKRICVYLDMDGEVRTDLVLKDVFKQGKTLFVPRIIGPHMDMLRLQSWEDYESLPRTIWNIRQPADSDVRENCLETGGLDLIVMPGLGFSMDGRRLGRGKGYYDSYLNRYREQFGNIPSLLALSFSAQISQDVPVDDHDVAMDQVLVPTS